MSRTLSGALLLLSVVLLRLAFPPYDLSLVMLVAWAPFLWAMRGARPRQALLGGFAHGVGLGVLGHFWIGPVIIHHTDVPAWQAIGAVLALAASCGLRSALYRVGLGVGYSGMPPPHVDVSTAGGRR